MKKKKQERIFKNIFELNEKEVVSLSVYNTGYQRCGPGHSWGPGVRDHFLIHHIVKGCGTLEWKGRTFSIHAGDSFLIYPYQEVHYYADLGDPWEYYWVGFSGTEVPSLMLATDFSEEQPIIHHGPKESQEMRRRLLSIYDARGNDLANQVEMTGRVYTLLSFLISVSSGPGRRNDSSGEYVKKAVDFIASNYSYEITVEEIADYVGISRSHLFRAFREHMGESPKEYLTAYRINAATALMRDSSLNIMAISRSVGFTDNLYFSKVFHKIKGVAPTVYMKKMQQNSI